MIFIKYFVRLLVESAGMALAETGAHHSVGSIGIAKVTDSAHEKASRSGDGNY